ncbi:DUF5666 domain-containing protein [Methylobacterium gregans]|uniref:DUF5666 domain-containing protein n=1 Tax=Methylobacterium gregans TaxID=374424 RepID=UPI00360FA6A0
MTSEVVGPVEAVGRDSLTVLGQRVATGGAVGPRQGESWTVGQRVAVSGLRRPDGVVVASLIEPRTAGPDRVAGPVRRGPDGALRIGGLRLTGAEHLPVGRRAALAGQARDGSLAVADAAETGLPPGIRTASIEAYIGRRKGGMILGSGLTVAGVPGANLPRSGAVRAVLTTEVAGDGRLTVERLRVDDRLAPVREPPREPGRFEGPGFQRDRLDLRGLPGHGPGATSRAGTALDLRKDCASIRGPRRRPGRTRGLWPARRLWRTRRPGARPRRQSGRLRRAGRSRRRSRRRRTGLRRQPGRFRRRPPLSRSVQPGSGAPARDRRSEALARSGPVISGGGPGDPEGRRRVRTPRWPCGSRDRGTRACWR